MRGMGEIWGVKGGDGPGGLWENLLTQPSSSNYMRGAHGQQGSKGVRGHASHVQGGALDVASNLNGVNHIVPGKSSLC